jgi:predicted nucleotidyltransferase
MQTIQAIFNKFPEVEEVHIFGSRARGIYKQGSDVDLAVMNQGVHENSLTKMRTDFEESSLPFKIDLINFPTLKHSEFIEHIIRVGITIYHKE